MEIGDTKICARDVRDRIDACQGKLSTPSRYFSLGNFLWWICSIGDSGGPMVISERGPDKKCELLPSWRIIIFTNIFLLDRFHLIGVVSFGYRCNVPGFPGKICPRGHSVLIWYFSLITQESTPELQSTTSGSRIRYRKISNLTLSILYSNLIIIKI